ncbi:MAG: SPOR domain-containing protein [Sphingomicrobium sp.]
MMRKLLLALAIAGWTLPAAAQSVRAGIDAWQKGDAVGAVAIWQPLADKGDADAAFNLGQAYRLGKGVPLDLAKAQDLFERSARKGHVDAQTTLGLLLFQNGNRVAAMRWLKAAADVGEPRAMLVYGTALYNGDGIAQDPVAAYAYVSRAAAQGLAPAQATLADMDMVMPVAVRQKGVTLAQAMVGGKPVAAKPVAGKTVVAKPVAAKPIAARPVAAKPAASSPSPPKPAPVAAAASGNWRIQLGAFAQRGSAEALFTRLGGKLGGARAYYIPVGKVVRLQAGPYASRAAAISACARLAGQACFAVEAR